MPCSDIDRQNLGSIRNQPGYEVLMQLMEEVCMMAESEHFRLDPAVVDAPKIAASQAVARAQRIFFERIQKLVEYEIAERLANQAPEQGVPDLEDDYTMAHLLNPLV